MEGPKIAISTLEKNNRCCDPFKKHEEKQKVVHNGLIKCSKKNFATKCHNLGFLWVTNLMKLCPKCRIRVDQEIRELDPLLNEPIQNIEDEQQPDEFDREFLEVIADLEPQSQESNPRSQESDPRSQSSTQPSSSKSSEDPSSSQGSEYIPSSQDSTIGEENYQKLLNLVNHLNIQLPEKPSTLKYHTNSYREAVARDLLEEILVEVKSLFPEELIRKVNFPNVFYENMKNEFKTTTSNEFKSGYLKCIPDTLTINDAALAFGVTKYAVRTARESKEAVAVGRPSISPDVALKVNEFYLQYGVSKELPGKKDCKSVKLPDGSRKKIQKRLLQNTLEKLHRQYKAEAQEGETPVGLSTFKKLRPKFCVFASDASALNVCVCMTHANTSMMVKSLKGTRKFEDQNDLCTYLTNFMMCPEADRTDACSLRECENCMNKKTSEFIEEKLSDIDEIKYIKWQSSPRPEKISVEEDIDSFLHNLDNTLESYIVHAFKCEKQREFVKNLKSKLVPGKEALVQMDFAERYTCITQNSIQSTYFNSNSVSIHPFVVYYKTREGDRDIEQRKDYIVISNTKDQNTNAVYTFQKKLIAELRKDKDLEHLKKIHYLSDGCAEQYKNKKNFKNLCLHKKDFGIEAEWHFFPTSHGKGACDGLGGTLKRTAANVSKRDNDSSIQINDALSFYNWATSHDWGSEKWNFIWVSDDECKTTEVETTDEGRYKDIIAIPGTLHFHSFQPRDENLIYASEYSGQYEREEDKKCFRLHLVKLIKKRKREEEFSDEDDETAPEVETRRSSRIKQLKMVNYDEQLN